MCRDRRIPGFIAGGLWSVPVTEDPGVFSPLLYYKMMLNYNRGADLFMGTSNNPYFYVIMYYKV